MGKFTQTAKKPARTKPVVQKAVGVTFNPGFKSQMVRSYEGGDNYTLDPIASLELILASSIFGEPAFYESADRRAANTVAAIDNALSYDFKATLDLAAKLRERAWMRLNPQIIFVRAAMHAAREQFTRDNPGYFAAIEGSIARRPDDITTQIEYYLFTNNGKNRMPGVLKRAAAKRLSEFSAYHINKYKGRGIGLRDVVRIVHAYSPAIDALMKDELKVEDTELTWKELRSAGKTWMEILDSGVSLSHSDLLYNLRGIVSEVPASIARRVVDKFVSGVEHGNIWPVKYYTAYQTLSEGEEFQNKAIALRGISRALESRIQAGKVQRKAAILIDGSASMTGMGWSKRLDPKSPAAIAALSGAITAKQYEEAHFVPFACDVHYHTVDNTRSVFDLVNDANAQRWNLGGCTEMGKAVRELINRKVVVDDIYIYSDGQATGGVWEAIQEYRKKLNPRVNVAVIQVAGYNNSVMPDNVYRGCNLASWTGQEVDYLLEISRIWDEAETRKG